MSDSIQKHDKGSIKDTLISITIALVVAFVFRAFVVEAFVIPTGSMAPTLMGQHMRFRSPQTGYEWPVNPWRDVQLANGQIVPARVQTNIEVTDPMSGAKITRDSEPLRSGDRILVIKYLAGLFTPQRFDCFVFKAPHEPQVNYIKRLLGLPGEQIALIDGDVFVRDADPDDATAAASEVWSLPDWRIARKPDRVQVAVWQDVFSSEYQPLRPVTDDRAWFRSPWVGVDGSWEIDGRRSYRLDGGGPGVLEWDSDRWPIGDRYPYNETDNARGARLRSAAPGEFTAFPINQSTLVFPVADLRMAVGVQPERDGGFVAATIQARGHEFRGVIEGETCRVQMRPMSRGEVDTPWVTLGHGAIIPLRAGRVTNVEFWHVDQALTLRVDDAVVAHGEYNWSPQERIAHATSRSIEWILREEDSTGRNVFGQTRAYAPGLARPRWEFGAGAVTLHRVSIARDVHYQPTNARGDVLLAAHPTRTPRLTSRLDGPNAFDQFFACGDNSPASSDSRMWEAVDPWVGHDIDTTIGIVPQRLVIGKAFGVYFPSLLRSRPVPMVDFGRVRWIW